MKSSRIDLEEVSVAGFSPLCPLGDYCTLIAHLLNSYTGSVLYPLIITEAETPEPLSLAEKRHIIRVRNIHTSDLKNLSVKSVDLLFPPVIRAC